MERDNNVLEMYDQPTRIQLHYQAHSRRKTRPLNTGQRWAMEKPTWEAVGGERK